MKPQIIERYVYPKGTPISQLPYHMDVEPNMNIPVECDGGNQRITVQQIDDYIANTHNYLTIEDKNELEQKIENIEITGGPNGVTINTDQTITGEKTFTTVPKSAADATEDTDLVNKKYIDNNINKVLQGVEDDLTDIYEVLYNQHSLLSISNSPSIIEKDIDASITTNWSIKFDDKEITPNTLSLKQGDNEVLNTTTAKTYYSNISDTTKYTITVGLKYGVNKSANAIVNAYYPMYFGSSSKTTLTSADILAMNKQSIKSSAAGSYSFMVNQAEYAWLNIPSNFNINKVTSGGFDVPMESPIIVAVDGKGDYKCYRSSSSINQGVMNIVIS